MARIRRTIRIKVPEVKVIRSGQMTCHYCGAVNQVTYGMKNPACWKCRNSLG